MIILDNSVLSSFARIGRLKLLRKILEKEEVTIPLQVYLEVIKAKSEGYDFAEELGRCIGKGKSKEKWILIKEVKGVKKFSSKYDIDYGEAAVIKLGLKNKALVVLDEKEGRKVAKKLKLNFTGTIGLLKLAYRNRIINKRELSNILKNLKQTNFRISSDLENWLLE